MTTMTSSKRGEKVRESLVDFNKYHVPEVEVELTEMHPDFFKVRFKGTFCKTCGFYDYFDDLMYNLIDIFGVKTEIISIEEKIDGALVEYRFV